MTKPDKDLDWLRDKVIALFEHASQGAGEDAPEGFTPDHPVCVKYIDALMELLPGKGGGERGNNHPDAATIEQVRLAIQQTTHPVPKSQTEP